MPLPLLQFLAYIIDHHVPLPPAWPVSRVGAGQNQPISAEQVQSALGSDKVNDLAAKAGISPDQASAGLAQILPKLIDKLTPEGQIPQASGGLGAARVSWKASSGRNLAQGLKVCASAGSRVENARLKTVDLAPSCPDNKPDF
ncbi:MAG: YidB family protein [Terriglobia bacterium]